MPGSKYMKVCVDSAWVKIDKYYAKLSDSPLPYVAVALHPSYRWKVFDQLWQESHPEWILEARGIVNKMWNNHYKDIELADVPLPGEARQLQPVIGTHNSFKAWKNQIQDVQDEVSLDTTPVPSSCAGDEFESWQATDKEGTFVTDPYKYWWDLRSTYPRLSQMALDHLTVPPMSAEVERLFSSAGLMVTPLRNRLKAETIGAVQALRSWNKAGLLTGTDMRLLKPKK